MAESFSNYCTKFNFSTATKPNSKMIVPAAGGRLGTVGSRPTGAVTQLHSIYLSQVITSTFDDPTTHVIYASLKIRDTADSNNEWYVDNNIMILPHSSFYIEKTITLTATQQLYIEYTSLNTFNGEVHCVCSGVDIV